MAAERRTTIGFDARSDGHLKTIEQEMQLNTPDAVRKGLALLALVAERQREGWAPAFIRLDGSVQEIYLV